MNTTNKNFIYNIIYQLLIFLIPLIITPYISRVLGVANIGIYSFTYSIVYYFMLASMLGISNYGAREIAKCQNKEETSKKFKSIYLLQLILNLICISIYIFMLIFFKISQKNIMLIQLIFLVSVAFDINWFFFGKEKFKITISRNIIIKLMSLILIFIFVKKQSDLWIYTLIMSCSALLSQMYLWLFLKKEINASKITFKDILSHLKPCLILFIPVISYSIYRVMDKTMIGMLSNTIELGNYESAEKIINIPISFITALGTVMMPHMSKKDIQEIKVLINNTFELAFFIIMPMILGLIIISKDFSVLFFGTEFTKTGTLIQILSISILFSSISNVVRTNFLIPLKMDKIYVISTIIGATINLICNVIFIKKYGAYGACVGTILAEFSLMSYQVIHTRRNINYPSIVKLFLKYFLKSLIMGLFAIIVGSFIKNIFYKLIFQITISIVLYFLLSYKYIINDFFGKK